VADVGIRGGRVVEVGTALSRYRSATVIDASDTLLLPGVIDAHVHPIHAETFGSVAEAAAYGGVTTLLHHVYQEPEGTLVETVRHAREDAEAASVVDFGMHLRITDASTAEKELPDVAALGVRSFKMFTAYRAKGIMVEDAALLRIMRVIGDLDALALIHAENGDVVDWLEADFRQGGHVLSDRYPASRPPEAEAEAVFRSCTLARIAKAAVYFVHLSGASALSALATARGAHQVVYAETCPHYLCLTADEVMHRQGAKAKIAPPLRTSADSHALWSAINDGVIDVVASDHSAFSVEEKNPSTGILDAGFGAPGVETLLPVMYEVGVRQSRISLEQLVSVLAERPAAIFGLERKGRIAAGFDADIVIFDPRRPRVISDDALHGRAYYSLFSGMQISGSIRSVFQRGQTIIESNRLVARQGFGQFVETRPLARGRETSVERIPSGAHAPDDHHVGGA
jgi:dihydropyrimidinase